MDRIIPQKKSCIILLILSLTIVGCAHFTTEQTDTSTATDGTVTTRTTRASATTLFDAKSDLAKFRASQSDKTQSAAVGTLGQESTTTNLPATLDSLTRLLNTLQGHP